MDGGLERAILAAVLTKAELDGRSLDEPSPDDSDTMTEMSMGTEAEYFDK